MKIRVYTIDFAFPRWLKRRFAYVGIPLLLVLGGVGGAIAAFDTSTITQNTKISAQRLKDNFDYLNTSLTTVSNNLATQKARLDGLKIRPTHIATNATLPVGAATTVTSASCSGIIISGGCATSGTAYVQASAVDGTDTETGTKWICIFYNPGPNTAVGSSQGYCLTP